MVWRKVVSLAFLWGLSTASVWAQHALENPRPNAKVSGISVLSGWKCTGGTIVAQFDGASTVQVAYGTARRDTEGACGDNDNGFGVLVNWNLLGNGTHTVRLFDNGVEFASATFTVVSTGEAFLRGLVGSAVALQFPTPSDDTLLEWQESLQNFVIVGGRPHVPGGDEETCLERFVSSVAAFGRYVTLDDRSVWEIDYLGRTETTLWLPLDDVLLCHLSSDAPDVRTLINLDRQDVVHGSPP